MSPYRVAAERVVEPRPCPSMPVRGCPPWFAGFVVAAMFLFVWGTLQGCTRSDMVQTANAMREVGTDAGYLINEVCVQGYDRAKTPEQIADLDKACLPAVDAYDAFRAAHLAMLAAIHASELRGTSDPAEMAKLAAELATAAEAMSRSMTALHKRTR